ncbi:MAG: M28 family peptidase, partial [Bacteroidetes bacterium]|nr:M28 family peptidase [Bacteroidota bacterium]
RELSGDTSTTIGGQPYTIISRYWEHAGNQKAAQYIYEKFLSFGLDTRYQIYRPNGVNVIAEKIGTKYPNQQFIICAHYDDGPILFPPFSDTIPGADDNASGVSTVLEAARVLSSFNFDYTLIFIAFDEEERVPNGSYGSRAYSDSAFANHDSIVGVMNLDMIAWDINNDFNFVVTTDSNSVMLADDMIAASLLYQPNLVPLKNIGFYGSDQLEFWRNGFVAIAPHEGDFNPYWHTVNDKFSNLNLPYFMSITKAVVGAFASLGWDYKINFIYTPIENSSDTSAKIAEVVISSSHQIASGSNAPRLYYKIGTGQFIALNAFYNNLDTFKFSVPGQPLGTEVSYYIAAQDSAGNMVGTLPSGGRGINPPGTIPPQDLFVYKMLVTMNQCSNTLPKSILDAQITYDTINISQNGTVDDVDVNLTLTHTYDGDLLILFNGPTGTQKTLSSFNGGAGQNYTNTTFDDEASIPITQGTPPFTGSFIPEQLLSQLDGISMNGNWILRIFDNTAGNQGTLLSWCVNVRYSNPISITGNTFPVEYELSQNYPNPFNPTTKINYSLGKSSDVKIIVYDALGKEVSTMVNGNQTAGNYVAVFSSDYLSTGMYYYSMYIDGELFGTKKMVIIK